MTGGPSLSGGGQHSSPPRHVSTGHGAHAWREKWGRADARGGRGQDVTRHWSQRGGLG